MCKELKLNCAYKQCWGVWIAPPVWGSGENSEHGSFLGRGDHKPTDSMKACRVGLTTGESQFYEST